MKSYKKEDMYDMKNTDVKIKHALIFIYKVKQYIGFETSNIFRPYKFICKPN